MSQADDLKAVLDDLGTAVTTAATNIDSLLQKVADAGTDKATIDAAIAEARAELDALKAANAKVNP